MHYALVVTCVIIVVHSQIVGGVWNYCHRRMQSLVLAACYPVPPASSFTIVRIYSSLAQWSSYQPPGYRYRHVSRRALWASLVLIVVSQEW